MKPLATNRQLFTWLCICQADDSVGNRERILYRIISLFSFGIVIIGFIASVMFIWKNISTDLESAIFAILQASAGLSLIYMDSAGFILRRKMTRIHERLTDICEERKYIKSKLKIK